MHAIANYCTKNLNHPNDPIIICPICIQNDPYPYTAHGKVQMCTGIPGVTVVGLLYNYNIEYIGFICTSTHISMIETIAL